MLCVRPGVFDVLAKPFLINSELMSDDLPTFERPRKAISGRLSSTQCRFSKALFTKSAEIIFIGSFDARRDAGRCSIIRPQHGRLKFYLAARGQSEIEHLIYIFDSMYG